MLMLGVYPSFHPVVCHYFKIRYKYMEMHKPRVAGLCLLQGRVVENISKRCGGFLRKLSLRGCLGVGDSALRWGWPWGKREARKLSLTAIPLMFFFPFFFVGLSPRTAGTLSCLVWTAAPRSLTGMCIVSLKGLPMNPNELLSFKMLSVFSLLQHV